VNPAAAEDRSDLMYDDIYKHLLLENSELLLK